MFSNWSRGLYFLLAAMAIAGLSGCASYSTFNPFSAPIPAYKAQYGLSPPQRVERLRQLAAEASATTAAEQQTTAARLATTLKDEADPILRRELTRTLGAFPPTYAQEGLSIASADDDPQVRAMACRAIAGQGDRKAMKKVIRFVEEDDNVDVRMAAVESLASFKEPEAIKQLGELLVDRDPAIQLTAMNAMRQNTGLELGSDVNTWREYAANLKVPESNGDSLNPGRDSPMYAGTSSSDASRNSNGGSDYLLSPHLPAPPAARNSTRTANAPRPRAWSNFGGTNRDPRSLW